MPSYLVSHPDFKKPRAVESADPKGARAHVAKEFEVRKLTPRECFDLAEQGVDLERVTRE